MIRITVTTLPPSSLAAVHLPLQREARGEVLIKADNHNLILRHTGCVGKVFIVNIVICENFSLTKWGIHLIIGKAME